MAVFVKKQCTVAIPTGAYIEPGERPGITAFIIGVENSTILPQQTCVPYQCLVPAIYRFLRLAANIFFIALFYLWHGSVIVLVEVEGRWDIDSEIIVCRMPAQAGHSSPCRHA